MCERRNGWCGAGDGIRVVAQGAGVLGALGGPGCRVAGVQGEGAGPRGREVAGEKERCGQVRWELVSGGGARAHSHTHPHTPSPPHSPFREHISSSNPSFCSRI